MFDYLYIRSHLSCTVTYHHTLGWERIQARKVWTALTAAQPTPLKLYIYTVCFTDQLIAAGLFKKQPSSVNRVSPAPLPALEIINDGDTDDCLYWSEDHLSWSKAMWEWKKDCRKELCVTLWWERSALTHTQSHTQSHTHTHRHIQYTREGAWGRDQWGSLYRDFVSQPRPPGRVGSANNT